ncbi:MULTISPECIES: DMT family transporter [unclassified Mucilaginibacter]|uniref:DMT family transporter n=1 Tax=unclassified Mucilaginibacter TaxID=2617802 RepID=UPI002AC92891|nr:MULTISPECIES: DMT family transporter [unclassified Mucilaginibacter]MEB0261926.1 DMT family transporter [Mucilaginibacter sp. 10I4]MEB0277655.1 DMT family transporter [Mucilaginibacter sp. 10B2]MEB0299570.1 DMT family transporter [Mucilaginibacter sp. 5C4]WPX24717.1 DMT family transporter [Mucilaginibacter sp. 5C4]
MKNLKIHLMLLLGMALFGSATPLSKLVTKDFPVFIAGGFRVLLAFIVLAPFVKLSNIKKYKRKDAWLLGGISLIGVLGFTVLMLYGMQMISGVTGSVIMSATPALTAVLSVIFFKDDFNWKKGIAIALAVAGVVVMQLGNVADKHGKNEILGIVLVAAAICCEAGYTLMGKALTKDYPPEDIATFSAIIGFFGFVPFMFWQFHEFSFANVSTQSWIYLALYGAGTMGLGSMLWYKGIQQVEGSTAATFMGVMPISALVLSYALLGEKFRWVHLIGFALVFSGVLLIISVHRQMKMKKM